jgi:hypothetical protein
MSIHNHLLFSEIFFQQVRRETTDLDNLRATLNSHMSDPNQGRADTCAGTVINIEQDPA